MKSVLEVFFEIVFALTGAVAVASLVVGGSALGIGCVIFGCTYAWRGWRRRRTSQGTVSRNEGERDGRE